VRHLLSKFVATVGNLRSPRRRPPARSTRLRVEALEDRLVATVNSMTELAQLFTPPPNETVLAPNFDGVALPYDGPNSLTSFTSAGGTEQDIQEILYRTSEMFAPFNVAVTRVFGQGDALVSSVPDRSGTSSVASLDAAFVRDQGSADWSGAGQDDIWSWGERQTSSATGSTRAIPVEQLIPTDQFSPQFGVEWQANYWSWGENQARR